MKTTPLVFGLRGLRVAFLLALGLALAACGWVQRTAPTATLPSAAGVGCFEGLAVIPATATPAIAQPQAEAHARAQREHEPGEIGELLQARLVTVTANPNMGSFQGKLAWLLTFAHTPPGVQPGPLPSALQHLQYQAQVLVDAQGDPPRTFSCAGLLPQPAPP